jgi:sugar O-acyltransferase (sialic acid O-acetyltransferase NeuD family)
MSKVIIFGTGQIAEIAHFYFKNDSNHEVVAFTVNKDFLKSNNFHSLPVIPYEDIVSEYPPDKFKFFLPISYQNINKLRAEKFEDVKKKGYECVSYISSKATYYNTPVGENCFIFENNVIQPYTKIGDNCVIWSGNHIGHHSIIHNHCFLASHIVVSGNVEIGEYTFIGVNATIRNNVKIGKENVIGASSVLLSNTNDREVFPSLETEKSRVPSNRLRSI